MPAQTSSSNNAALPAAEFGARLERWRVRHNLSLRKLETVLGNRKNLSRPSLGRIEQNQMGREFARFTFPRIVPEIEAGLEQYLKIKGATPEEIETELLDLFPDRKDRKDRTDEMITTRTRLTEDVLEHFNLQRDPFALENDPRSADEAFSTKEIERLVRRVEDAVNFQGFLCVLGAVGAGKTSLKHRVADHYKKNDRTHLIFPKFVNMEKLNEGAIVHYLLRHFGQKPTARLALAQVQLEKHLAELNERGARVAIGFDECHRLSDTVLTSLKNFYEMGTGGYDRYLGLILFGQPQFRARLDRAEFREIAERLEILEMPSLSRYAGDYLRHRLALAGGAADEFSRRRQSNESPNRFPSRSPSATSPRKR
jgi:type II secretory pathway predicted ATPase ExeA